MKKFLLSFCVLAVASVCVFMTSCKDEDALAAAAKNIPAPTVPFGYTSATYSYVLDGVTYNSIEELNAALATMDPGSTHTAQVIVTGVATDGTKTVVKGNEFELTIPVEGGEMVIPTVNIPALPDPHKAGSAE